jgi:cation:H+ antiporter
VDLLTLVLFILGLPVLIAGAELLVAGAAGLAARLGVTPLVIGLTVVAFGTSAPELAVTASAAVTGRAEIALGNIVGSNICNVLLILGLAAVITPLRINVRLIRVDVPVMVLVTLVTWGMTLDGSVSRVEGGLLVLGIVVYTALTVYLSRRTQQAEAADFEQEFSRERLSRRGGVVLQGVMVLGGLGLLVLGSQWLVDGAVALARLLGASELIIGMTIVAVGTSLPEIATTALAAIRGERDIAVGNVVGSNIFNLLAALGVGAVAARGGVPVGAEALDFDVPMMVAVAVVCVPLVLAGAVVPRWQGGLLVLYYAAFLLVQAASASPGIAAAPYRSGLLWATAALIVVATGPCLWRRRTARAEA